MMNSNALKVSYKAHLTKAHEYSEWNPPGAGFINVFFCNIVKCKANLT